MITADAIPITETKAMDLRAGCPANNNTPVAVIVVNPESNTEVLNDLKLSLPN
jgi:hypothetical protein